MKAKLFFLSIWLLICPLSLLAQEEGDSADQGGSIYVEMQPAFIATFGGPGPLKYLKTEITLIVPSISAEADVKLHDPMLRDALVMLLSRQSSENVSTAAARDVVRQEALEKLRNLMLEEYGPEGYDMIKNLLFTSFVVQQ